MREECDKDEEEDGGRGEGEETGSILYDSDMYEQEKEQLQEQMMELEEIQGLVTKMKLNRLYRMQEKRRRILKNRRKRENLVQCLLEGINKFGHKQS
mmetsp:Transcript_11849/g.20035  ORF Transcript_11849/g.20035 Transcript_11849/m.20035 type:complete len:97 (+) Transcript_11849:305-595(+)